MNKMIKKIELDLGGKKVALTPEQAKNLKDALDELFEKEVIKEKEYVPYYPPYRYPFFWEWQPYWVTFTSESNRGGTSVGNYTLNGSSFDSNTSTLCLSAN
jgi:hypothetical protein